MLSTVNNKMLFTNDYDPYKNVTEIPDLQKYIANNTDMLGLHKLNYTRPDVPMIDNPPLINSFFSHLLSSLSSPGILDCSW